MQIDLKIAWRNLIKTRLHSAINIAGLACGMAVALLIGFWVKDELTFNHGHTRHEQLAAVMSTVTLDGKTSTYMAAPVPLAGVLRNNYAEDFKMVALISGMQNHSFRVGDKQFSSSGFWAQPDFPIMFTFPLVKGDLTALKEPTSMLISRSMAKSLFGNQDPVNQAVKVDGRFNLKVAGVYADLPANSSFAGVDFLLPWENIENPGSTIDGWNSLHYAVYVLLNKQSDATRITEKIKDLSKPHIRGGQYESLLIHPMDRWHLYDQYRNGRMAGGRIEVVRMFGLTGFLVLLLACINFMNLSTARSGKRAKEVGIRKTIGSSRWQLMAQFFGESLLMSFLSLILALFLVLSFLPLFNRMTGKIMVIPWGDPVFWILLSGFAFVTGLLAGSWPAFYLSHFDPVRVLKGSAPVGRFSALPRKSLVVMQFTVSIALIIATVIIFRQIELGKHRSLGYHARGLLSMNANMTILAGHYTALRNDLLHSGAVTDMAESSSRLTNLENEFFGYDWSGRDPHSTPAIGTLGVTHDFGRTVGWRIIAGRDFSRDFPSDTGAVVINEAAAKYMGFRSPVGEIIRWNDHDHRVIGVIGNIVMESPYAPVAPTLFRLDYGWVNNIYIRLNPSMNEQPALSAIAAVFKKYDPDDAFDYQFTDELYGEKFYEEEQTVSLARIFATLAIFISCLGLFGLAAFVAEQRTKEMGIRKLLGAKAVQLWILLSKDFVTLVVISSLIAGPLAWYFLHGWLQRYEYRTTVSWWIFVLAGAAALLIALLTVSFQAIKATRVNPASSLRSE